MHCEMDENNQKEAGFGPYLKKSIADTPVRVLWALATPIKDTSVGVGVIKKQGFLLCSKWWREFSSKCLLV